MNNIVNKASAQISNVKAKLQQKREEIGASLPANKMAFDKFERGLFNKISWRDK